MAESLPDDSSAASSGDEMLNMICPFSQESKCIGKGSDNDDADDDGGDKGKPQDAGKKRKYEAIAVESGTDAAEKMAEKEAIKALRIAFHDSKIGAPDKLSWQRRTKKGKKMIVPVRVVPKEETVGLALKAWKEETHVPVQDIQYSGRGEYSTASKTSLSPYYGKGAARDRWCPNMFEQYSKQLKRSRKGVDLKTEESYLKCVLEKSLEEGEQEKKLAEVDEAVPKEISAFERDNEAIQMDSEEDEDDEETRGCRRSRRRSTCIQNTTERLRPGDRIEYWPTQCVAGRDEDRREATILFIDPKGDRILTLDDPYTILPPDHQVKRIERRNNRGKMVKNDGAQFRPINEYTLRKEGDSDAHRKLLLGDAAKGKEIIRKGREKLVATAEKEGFCPKDLLL